MSLMVKNQVLQPDTNFHTKPYTRRPLATPSKEDSVSLGVESFSSPIGSIPDTPGFPTYAQYKHIETTYITSLTPRRQQKALINQAMFDRIWDVLHKDDTRPETSQFRFWVRKMFVLCDKLDGTTVIHHNNLPLAIQEQLYPLLCYCHARVNHSGRDRTRACVTEHYSWVPKEIVSQFVKACPTCILKRTGPSKCTLLAIDDDVKAGYASSRSLAEIHDLLVGLSTQDASDRADAHGKENIWPPDGGPLDIAISNPSCSSSGFGFTHSAFDSTAPSGLKSPNSPDGLRSCPMSREVSLFQGLPNGWQHSNEYPDAYANFSHHASPVSNTTAGTYELKGKRPRVPSIITPVFDRRQTRSSARNTTSPLITSVPDRESISPTMESSEWIYAAEIDPVLLGDVSKNPLNIRQYHGPPSSPTVYCVPLPPLNLHFINTTFQEQVDGTAAGSPTSPLNFKFVDATSEYFLSRPAREVYTNPMVSSALPMCSPGSIDAANLRQSSVTDDKTAVALREGAARLEAIEYAVKTNQPSIR